VKKTAFMAWVDRKIKSDPGLKKMVQENLAEMRLEQELAALRARRGMTQKELAARMGVSQPVIAKLESGAMDPGDALIRKLENELGIKLKERVESVAVKKQTASGSLTLGDLVKMQEKPD